MLLTPSRNRWLSCVSTPVAGLKIDFAEAGEDPFGQVRHIETIVYR
jgi:hypothetical protein